MDRSLEQSLRATTLSTLRKFLDCYVPTLGKPLAALSDRGSQFTAKAWTRELNAVGIKVRFCSPRHPASNPAERVMREIGRVFKAYCSNKHTTWSSMVPKLTQWLNLTTHDSTGYTPYQLQFGRKPVSEYAGIIEWPADKQPELDHETVILRAGERLRQRAASRSAAAEGVGKHIKFNPGDLTRRKIFNQRENGYHSFWTSGLIVSHPVPHLPSPRHLEFTGLCRGTEASITDIALDADGSLDDDMADFIR
ncbi:hypothetical protein B566_EDAN004709 [Ephemera danica]|nr:hypothetical protein B566_EDAN004709 [Ephemera danica]